MDLLAAVAHRGCRLFIGALIALSAAAPAQAQSIAAGDAYFNNPANCVSCHTGGPASPYPAAFNAANAGHIVQHALNAGMAGLTPTPTQLTSLGMYIDSLLTQPSPNNQSVPFNPGGASPTVLATNLVIPSPYGALTGWQFVGGAAKGTVSFGASELRYTPDACALGPDSFTYRGTGPSGNSSDRSGSVTIANPVSAPTLSTGAPTNTGQTGVFYSFNNNVSACESLVTYSISSGSLPPGLTLGATGVISGTPTTVGTFNGTIRAAWTAVPGLFDSQAFSITISLGPPNITSPATAASGSVGVPYAGYTVAATNSPTSFNATGLPPGLSIDTGTGSISGTPTDASGSPYVANVTATNATATDNQNVTFNIVPAINSAPAANGQTGVPFSYQITEAAGPAFTTHAALDPLPPGLSLAAGTGLISGTPTVVGGPTNVRLTGANAFGTSAQFTLAITITLGPPQITSPLAAAAGVTVPFNYQIVATNPPHTSFNATGLPAGLSIDTNTGVISGAPSPGTGGVHNVSISATNATGTDTETLAITVAESAPVVTSPATANGQTGSPFSYQITALNGVISYGATGLPPGLSVNPATGLISGTPALPPGVHNATISATNGAGTGNQALTITIALGPPVITSPNTAGGNEGFAFSYQITATNAPTSYAASGLPPGVTVNAATGLVAGTPTATGTFNATVSATNATATANQALTIVIGVGLPVITSPATATGATGLPFDYVVTATNGATAFGAAGLPPGLSINASTGVISGAPTQAGTFTASLSATNGTGTSTRPLTITIELRPPDVVSPLVAHAVMGVPFRHQIGAANGATSFSARNLPPGLSLDTTSGLISGTPTAGGTFAVPVTATNPAGAVTFTLTIHVAFVLPTAGSLAVEVPFQQATSITLPITGADVTVNIVSLPEHGLLAVQPGGNVVVYTPANNYSGPDRFTYSVTNPAGTTAAATVDITVGASVPIAVPITFTAQLDTPTTVDFGTVVSGTGLTGIAIRDRATHGRVEVNGMQVTYTPRTGYFGTDSFTYIAFGSLGASSVATVTVQVVGRPDPASDPHVTGLIDAQNQAARRFAGAQIGNFQRRMEALHRTPVEASPPPASPPVSAPAPAPSPAAPAKPYSAVPATRVAANDTLPTRSDAGGWLPTSLVGTIMQAVTARSLDVSASSGHGGPRRSAPEFWIAGSAHFGRLDPNGERSGLEFGTDGISVGMDRFFGERLALGIGAGYARDETDVGSDGRSRSKARGASVAVYGSYQPSPRTFIDVLLGYGDLRFESQRHVEAVDAVAQAKRDGRQVFGSVAAGYEWRRDNLLVSPYGRVDFSADRLDEATEQGAGQFALAFKAQDQRSLQAAVGVRAESKHETEFGWAVPRARAEYRHEFEGDRIARIAYADLFGDEYTVRPTGVSRNAFLLGVGADLVFRGGLRVGLDYTAHRATGASNVQSVRLLVSQDLDARGAAPWRFEPLLYRWPVNVDLGYTWDDNLNRSRVPAQRLEDHVFSMSATHSRHWPIGTNARVQVTGLLSGEKLDRWQGLGRIGVGGQAEVQYRSSGAFDATTYALVGRATYERYESDHRTGPRFFAGVNARRALTDRIEVFGEVGAHRRDGRSEVFRWNEYAAKVNLDYSLGRRGIVYLTGEYRRGDTVSSGLPSLANVGLAEVFVPDDAFADLGYLAYRFDSRTVLATLGWNLPLGARDSLDLSWRRIQSRPTRHLGIDWSGSLRYVDNQYAIVYLMRF